MKQYLTFKNLLIAVCLVIIAILLLKGCGGRDDKAKKLKEESDAAKSRYENKIKSLDAELSIKDDSMKTLKNEREAAVNSRQHLSSLLTQSHSKASQLAQRIKILTTYDTSQYNTPLTKPCDSLADMVFQLEKDNKEKDDWILQVDSLMMYEVNIRDEVIMLLQNKFVTCDSNLTAERGRFNQLYKTLRPRNVILLGGEIIGGKETVFAQAGGVVSLFTKKQKLYQVSIGMMTNGQPYGRLNANFPISFRKK